MSSSTRSARVPSRPVLRPAAARSQDRDEHELGTEPQLVAALESTREPGSQEELLAAFRLDRARWPGAGTRPRRARAAASAARGGDCRTPSPVRAGPTGSATAASRSSCGSGGSAPGPSCGLARPRSATSRRACAARADGEHRARADATRQARCWRFAARHSARSRTAPPGARRPAPARAPRRRSARRARTLPPRHARAPRGLPYVTVRTRFWLTRALRGGLDGSLGVARPPVDRPAR